VLHLHNHNKPEVLQKCFLLYRLVIYNYHSQQYYR